MLLSKKRCKDTTFAAYFQILTAKNAAYCVFLAVKYAKT